MLTQSGECSVYSRKVSSKGETIKLKALKTVRVWAADSYLLTNFR